MKIGLLVEGEIDVEIVPLLLKNMFGSVALSAAGAPVIFPYPPNGFGEIPKNLRMLVLQYKIPSERDRIGCDLFVIVHDSRKTEAIQKEIRDILRRAPDFPAVYGLAVQETEAWVLGDIDHVNRHVFKVSPSPKLPQPPERDPDPKKTLSDLFVRPSPVVEFDRWNRECARRVAPHLRPSQVAHRCPRGFGRLRAKLGKGRSGT